MKGVESPSCETTAKEVGFSAIKKKKKQGIIYFCALRKG